MGKRELLLIAVFVVAGVVVWQVTAPASDPNKPGFSLQRFLNSVRTELAGQRAEVSLERSATAPVPPVVGRLVLADYRGAITLVGEDRDDVTALLKGTAFGAEPAETQAIADKITLALKQDGADVILLIGRPETRRRPRLQLEVKVPRRLAARLDVQGERVEVRQIAAVDANLRFASSKVSDIAGEVKIEQRDGRLEITKAGSVGLLTRRTEVRVEQVAGRARIEATDDRVTLRTVSGPASLETRRVEVEAEGLGTDLSATLVDGTFSARNVTGPITLESQRCRVALTVDGRSPIGIVAGDAPVDIAFPETARVTLDLEQLDGEIRLPSDSGVTVTSEEGHQTARGAIRGGGPLVKVRARQGGITIR